MYQVKHAGDFRPSPLFFAKAPMTEYLVQNRPLLVDRDSGSGSGLYSGGLTWSIVLKCDNHTGIFTCDGCARDPYFHVPAETQSYAIKLSCSRKVLAASGD